MNAVVDLTTRRAARREAELRKQFDVPAGEPWKPIGMVAELLVDEVRIRMAERRNREARR